MRKFALLGLLVLAGCLAQADARTAAGTRFPLDYIFYASLQSSLTPEKGTLNTGITRGTPVSGWSEGSVVRETGNTPMFSSILTGGVTGFMDPGGRKGYLTWGSGLTNSERHRAILVDGEELTNSLPEFSTELSTVDGGDAGNICPKGPTGTQAAQVVATADDGNVRSATLGNTGMNSAYMWYRTCQEQAVTPVLGINSSFGVDRGSAACPAATQQWQRCAFNYSDDNSGLTPRVQLSSAGDCVCVDVVSGGPGENNTAGGSSTYGYVIMEAVWTPGDATASGTLQTRDFGVAWDVPSEMDTDAGTVCLWGFAPSDAAQYPWWEIVGNGSEYYGVYSEGTGEEFWGAGNVASGENGLIFNIYDRTTGGYNDATGIDTGADLPGTFWDISGMGTSWVHTCSTWELAADGNSGTVKGYTNGGLATTWNDSDGWTSETMAGAGDTIRFGGQTNQAIVGDVYIWDYVLTADQISTVCEKHSDQRGVSCS